MKAMTGLLVWGVLLMGCSASGYQSLSGAADLPAAVGQPVKLTGQRSKIPWAHVVAPSTSHPFPDYFDLSDGQQIVVYFTASEAAAELPPDRPVAIFGTVVAVEGRSKGEPRTPFTEYHLKVDRWERLD